MPNAAILGRFFVVGTVIMASAFGISTPAQARLTHHSLRHHAIGSHAGLRVHSSSQLRRGHGSRALVQLISLHRNSKYAFLKGSKGRYARDGYGYGHLQCVTFARAASGIELKGNAADWWDAAAGVYQRGSAPEPGSVLNFRANGHMRLGHVAVVTAVLDPRTVSIEHANWAGPGANKGGVARNIPVEDVSPNNDWTEVRVGLGRSGDFGSTYRTYGFIYDRPDTGTMIANRNSAGSDGTPATAQAASFTEVAQAPADNQRTAPARPIPDAPSRNLQ